MHNPDTCQNSYIKSLLGRGSPEGTGAAVAAPVREKLIHGAIVSGGDPRKGLGKTI